jgi:hypothetical protein
VLGDVEIPNNLFGGWENPMGNNFSMADFAMAGYQDESTPLSGDADISLLITAQRRDYSDMGASIPIYQDDENASWVSRVGLDTQFVPGSPGLVEASYANLDFPPSQPIVFHNNPTLSISNDFSTSSASPVSTCTTPSNSNSRKRSSPADSTPGIGSFQCTFPQCSSRFFDGSTRRRHEAEQHKSKTFDWVCSLCQRTFGRKSNCLKHIGKYHAAVLVGVQAELVRRE